MERLHIYVCCENIIYVFLSLQILKVLLSIGAKSVVQANLNCDNRAKPVINVSKVFKLQQKFIYKNVRVN